MANWIDFIQGLASAALHISELKSEVSEIRKEVPKVRTELSERIQAVALDVAVLKEAQATTRETVQTEITKVVCELRLDFARIERDLQVDYARQSIRPRLSDADTRDQLDTA